MTAAQLVRIYPRRWRERYGEEFVETVGAKRLHAQQVIDIVSGAIDAWISVRSKAASAQAAGGGSVMVQQWKSICATNTVRYTKRDALVSAGVLIAGTILLLAAGIFLNSKDYPVAGDAVKSLAFPVAMTISMPFALLKGQPKRIVIFTTTVTIGLLAIATFVATKI